MNGPQFINPDPVQVVLHRDDGTQIAIPASSVHMTTKTDVMPMTATIDPQLTMATTSQTTSYTFDVTMISAAASAASTAMTTLATSFGNISLGAPITSFDPNYLPTKALPPRHFNKYVNASDLLEEFIRYLGTLGVRQGDLMGLPIELFIKWLVIRACEEDKVEPEVTLELPAPLPQPRCLGCQRWMSRGVSLPLHGDQCASRYFARQKIAA